MPRLAARAAGLAPSTTAALDARAKALIADGADVVNLTGGEAEFPTVAPAADAAVAAIEEGFTRYTPAAGMRALRRAVADHLDTAGLHYGPENVLITAGAKQALFHAFMALVDPGDEVLVPAPYWVSYPEMIRLAGGAPVPLWSGGSGLRAETLAAALTPRTRVLLLNNPGNPTGDVLDRLRVAELVQAAAAHGVTVISDEIFDHLVYGGEFVRTATLGSEDSVVTVGGFSKTYAMTGWRIGYAAGPASLIAAMTAIQSHTTSAPSSISQRAALGALSADLTGELERRRQTLDRQRRQVLRALAELPLLAVEGRPQGGFFVFLDVSGTYGWVPAGEEVAIADAAGFAEALLRRVQVAVVPGADFGAPNHVRLSFTPAPDQLDEALDRLRAFLTDLSLPA